MTWKGPAPANAYVPHAHFQGYVIKVVSILDVGQGKIMPGTGLAEFRSDRRGRAWPAQHRQHVRPQRVEDRSGGCRLVDHTEIRDGEIGHTPDPYIDRSVCQ